MTTTNTSNATQVLQKPSPEEMQRYSQLALNRLRTQQNQIRQLVESYKNKPNVLKEDTSFYNFSGSVYLTSTPSYNGFSAIFQFAGIRLTFTGFGDGTSANGLTQEGAGWFLLPPKDLPSQQQVKYRINESESSVEFLIDGLLVGFFKGTGTPSGSGIVTGDGTFITNINES